MQVFDASEAGKTRDKKQEAAHLRGAFKHSPLFLCLSAGKGGEAHYYNVSSAK